MADALPLLQQAVDRSTSVQLTFLRSLLVGWLSEAYLLAGHGEDASQHASRALELAREHKERGHEAWALRLLGEIAAHADPPEVEQAESYYRQALALAEELEMRPLVAHCRLGLGAVYRQIGHDQQAQAELTVAAEMYRAMEMPFWLTKAKGALAQVAG